MTLVLNTYVSHILLGVDLLLILEKNGYQIDAKTKTAFLLKLLLHNIRKSIEDLTKKENIPILSKTNK